MSETKHTPGPWRHNGAAGIYGANGKRCANVFVKGEIDLPEDEIDANAQIIVAALDLLDAAELAVRTTMNPVAEERLRAAIAKARG